MNVRVGELYCYPVKSCRGLALETADIGRMGIRYDRQWMTIDERGMFVAQRGEGVVGVGVRTMCLIETAIRGESLMLTAPRMTPLTVPLAGTDGPSRRVQVWRSHCTAVDQGAEAAGWLTEYLSRERAGSYRLVRMADDGVRAAKRGPAALAFADGYPFLIVSQASLDDLNRRLPAPLPVNRFRPNIVLDGCTPYAEDTMARLRIGPVDLFGMTLCLRCPIPATNQLTAELGKEPLRTLATYRRTQGGGVVFARNFNHLGAGRIARGQTVEVLAWDEGSAA